MSRKVLYRVLSWGLGHATRSLPVIRHLAGQGHRVTVSSCDRALQLLRSELGPICDYHEFPGLDSSWGRDHHWVFLLPGAPAHIAAFRRAVTLEQRAVENEVAKNGYDLLVSDHCYGAHCDGVPSFFLGHHLRPFWFWRAPMLQRLNERLLATYLNRFDGILVPDYPGSPLSGALSSGFTAIDPSKVTYLGILSSYCRLDCERDIDYLVIVSGHEPQRTSFERLIRRQIQRLEGRVVVLLGTPERAGERETAANVEYRYFEPAAARNELLNRARFVISRPGYTTLMDSIELDVPHALFVPTPNQTEQEYLSDYHGRQGNFHSVPQRRMALERDVQAAHQRPLWPTGFPSRTADSLARLDRVLASLS
jgi:UDP-N-acetylglucosamine transferase subunit ALG13